MEKRLKLMYIIIIVLIVGQIATFSLLITKTREFSLQLNSTQTNLNDKIDTNAIEVNSKINTITDSLNSISSIQSSLTNQVSEIKARTSADFSLIIEKTLPAVVSIKTDMAQGSGFIITESGYIVTNAHVLSQANYANIYTYDNNRYSATLIGYNNELDIALLKVSGSFSKLNLANSNNVKLGEKVIAIGNPLGLSFTTTEGIISGLDRLGANDLPYYFQTDVSLNPGNSGGPLINTKGEVIGINNFKIAGAESLGFALESNYVEEVVNAIALDKLNQTLI